MGVSSFSFLFRRINSLLEKRLLLGTGNMFSRMSSVHLAEWAQFGSPGGSPGISGNLPWVSRESSVSRQGFPGISRNFRGNPPARRRECLGVAGNLPRISRESPVSRGEFPVLSGNLPGVSREFPESRRGSPGISRGSPGNPR